MDKSYPTFFFERKLWKNGFGQIAGVDEVGRGCFAGPVVAAALAFAPMTKAKWLMLNGVRIDDSKKLKPREREIASAWIKKNALSWGIGEVSVGLINRMGIGQATKVAFRSAVIDANRRLQTKGYGLRKGNRFNTKVSRRKAVDFLLIDAFFIPHVRGLRRKNQKAIIKGDEKSISIAAASIVAKVYRDKLMRKLSHKYPQYGWGRNKGYGTRLHREAILKYGVTEYHRKDFVSTFLSKLA